MEDITIYCSVSNIKMNSCMCNAWWLLADRPACVYVSLIKRLTKKRASNQSVCVKDLKQFLAGSDWP